MAKLIDVISGNKYDWDAFKAPAPGVLNKINTKGLAMVPGIKDYVLQRVHKAIADNDIEETARLKKYYDNFTISGMVVEAPVSIDGITKYCYVSREKGFVCPDAELGPMRWSLRALLKELGAPLVIPKTMDELEELFIGNQTTALLVDLIAIGTDLIVIGADALSMESGYGLLGDLNFPECEAMTWVTNSYFSDIDAEFWRQTFGAVKLDCPILEDGPYVLPIVSLQGISELIDATKKPQLRCELITTPISLLLDMKAGDGFATITKDMIKLKPSIDGLPITKEQLKNISIDMGDSGGISLIPDWGTDDDGNISVSIAVAMLTSYSWMVGKRPLNPSIYVEITYETPSARITIPVKLGTIIPINAKRDIAYSLNGAPVIDPATGLKSFEIKVTMNTIPLQLNESSIAGYDPDTLEQYKIEARTKYGWHFVGVPADKDQFCFVFSHDPTELIETLNTWTFSLTEEMNK